MISLLMEDVLKDVLALTGECLDDRYARYVAKTILLNELDEIRLKRRLRRLHGSLVSQPALALRVFQLIKGD